METCSPHSRVWRVVAPAAVFALLIAGCGASDSTSTGSAKGTIGAVGAENQYANVIAQVGGKYVSATAIVSNPNTDPHTFEASPSVAETVGGAQLVVENGVGYDAFMQRIESASPDSSRKVINVQHLLGLPDSTSNPHLWYKPAAMPAVAAAVARDLSALQPSHAGYFRSRAAAFDASLKPWLGALTRLRRRYGGTAVATTEPVGDYMLEAAGMRNLTPVPLQAAIMNGTDPAPQDVSLQQALFSGHKVKAFVYNQQVTDTLTTSFLKSAAEHHVPVVGVYETMPVPGYDYQSWMLAEVKALEGAIADGTSTEKL